MTGTKHRRPSKPPRYTAQTSTQDGLCAPSPTYSRNIKKEDSDTRSRSLHANDTSQDMGITGLIPFLEKASKRGNISQFAGGTVAIDTYCWLHKGAFSCADKIAMGQPTDAYVKYCMKFVHMLLANRIKPILVFDGRHLPAKKETEVKRRENRESTRRRAAELMRMGQNAEGRNLLRRSVDITHEMALELIKKCQEENVDCIVAPYEADAQLAYLNITGIADVVITEDSDLTLFGCKKIFFKMDINGNGLLVEQDRLHLAMNVRAEHFDMDKFRHMCILSGCDYLASLPGIGLSKACKFILRNRDEDIHKALTRLGSYLNMKALVVTNEYRDAFIRALITFKHQLVYCPLQRKQVRLYPPSPEITDEQLRFAGDEIAEDVAYQMALGNYDPFTMQELHNYDPDLAKKRKGKTNVWHEKPSDGYISIWSRDYKVVEEKENGKTRDITRWPNTAGQIVTLNTDSVKQKTTPKKRNFAELAEELSANDVLELYGGNKLQKTDEAVDGRATPPSHLKSSPPSPDGNAKSPMSPRRTNPFAKATTDSQVSPSLVCRGKRRIKLKNFVGFRPTIIDDKNVQTSKYFSPDSSTNDSTLAKKNGSDDCPRIDESIVARYEGTDNRETNFIEDTHSPEKLSGSSGIFSNDSASEDNIAFEINAIKQNDPVVEKKMFPEIEKMNDSDLDGLRKTEYPSYNRTNDGSASVSVEVDDDGGRYLSAKNNESLRCSLFKWANTKDTKRMPIKSAPRTNKPTATAKINTAKKIGSQGKSVPAERQQSLLNMFGFQKKSVLKHAIVTTIETNDAGN